MKTPRITLRVTRGPLKGWEFVFDRPALCVIGRGDNCAIRLPSDAEHAGVSRRHCLLEVAPAGLRVRDLGSTTGTYVNGQPLRRSPGSPPREGEGAAALARELRDGDELRVGLTVLRVSVAGSGEATSEYVPAAMPRPRPQAGGV